LSITDIEIKMLKHAMKIGVLESLGTDMRPKRLSLLDKLMVWLKLKDVEINDREIKKGDKVVFRRLQPFAATSQDRK